MELDGNPNEKHNEVDQIENDGTLDDDGKPKRTGSFNLSQNFLHGELQSLFNVFMYSTNQNSAW
jgi:hypothetical protein